MDHGAPSCPEVIGELICCIVGLEIASLRNSAKIDRAGEDRANKLADGQSQRDKASATIFKRPGKNSTVKSYPNNLLTQ